MNRALWPALGLAASLSVWVACQPQSPALVKAPIQTAALPPAPKTSAPPISPLANPPSCSVVDAENRSKFNEALAKWEESSFVDGGTAQYSEVLPNPCISAGNGVWAVALQAFTPYTYPLFDATWSLVHIDKNGALLRYSEDSTTFTAGAGGGPYGPTKFWSFDFDDDGDAELIFTYDLVPVETAEVFTMSAYRFKDGRIKPYDPVPGWTDLKDVDNDGRPDALVVHNSEDYGGCGAYESETLIGPTLVAHSVHGGFSTIDAVAKSAAAKGCPARPSKVVEMDGRQVDEGTTAENVICARVWGATEASVVHEVESACRPMSCSTLGPRARLPGECMHLQTLIKWAKEPPIVALP